MLLFWWRFLLSAFLLACSNHVSLSVSGAKILVFSPTLSRSHMISNARVADVLARDGHNVTLLEVEYNVPVKAMNASKAARTVHVSGQFMPQTIDGMNRQEVLLRRLFETTSLRKAFFFTKIFQITLNEACEEFISTQSRLISQLKAESFDMLIAEQLNFCGAGLAHLLRIPTYIQLSSCSPQEHVASLMGVPNPSSYLPSLLGPVSTESWPLVNRLNNFAYHLAASFAYFHYGIDPLTGIFRQKFGSNFTDLREIVKDSPLVLINVDELVDFPRPMFPNFVYIGGLGMEEAEEQQTSLQEPFLSQMAKGAHGVVFFSMGSVVRSTGMTEPFRRHLFQAFARITDYHFIVKIEKEDHFSAGLAEGVDNVFISAWVPQSDMLFHPRLKLFITHGGYNSLMEAARAGVPLITMGFFADQYRNGRLAERNGWALPFDKQLLCEGSEQFRAAIKRVLEDPGYKKSAKRTQRLIRTKPFSAEERLTKSIRFLELNGGKLPELLSESRNLNAIEFYNLDLIFLFALGAIIFLAVSIFSVSYVGRNFKFYKAPLYSIDK